VKNVVGATAVFGFSMIVTASAIGALVPGHPRLDAAAGIRHPNVVPAVVSSDPQQRPGSEGVAAEPAAPATGCPYLQSGEGRPSCPVMPEMKTDATCPFLTEQREKGEKGTKRSSPVLGQHT
jgi:hypothetical protein